MKRTYKLKKILKLFTELQKKQTKIWPVCSSDISQLIFKPWSVPRVWSVVGPEELAGWDVPVIRLQPKSAGGRGSRPQREPWKVHSLSAGQEPLSLLDTFMLSMAMLPCVPPTTASMTNWRTTIHQKWRKEINFVMKHTVCIFTLLKWLFKSVRNKTKFSELNLTL